jgi:hypothetical protein
MQCSRSRFGAKSRRIYPEDYSAHKISAWGLFSDVTSNIPLPSHCRIYVSSGASRDGQQCYRLGVRYGRMMICSRCFKSLSGKRQLYIFIPSANKSQSPCSLSTTLCLSAPSQLLASIMFDRARVRVSVSEVPSPIVSDMSRYAA